MDQNTRTMTLMKLLPHEGNEVEEFSPNIIITEFYEAKGADACARDKHHGINNCIHSLIPV